MTDGETSAMYSVLRGLDGVDEKMLKRPEVAYLSSVLEDGELPECVLDGRPPDFAVATDRRIIHVQRTVFGNKIRKHESCLYRETVSIERSMGICVINAAERTIRINAPKDKTEAFIAFVNSKIAEHKGPDVVDAPDPELPPPEEAVTDSETSAIYSVLWGLDGVDKTTLERPEAAYLPSALEDGEMPECLLVSLNEFVVATDRRLIYVNKEIGRKAKIHGSFPYREIYSLEHSSKLMMHSLIIKFMHSFSIDFGSEDIVVNASKERIESFIAFVKPKIDEYRDTDPSMIYSVLRGLGSVDEKTLAGPLVAYLPTVLEDGELPECALDASNQFVVATDRRIIYVEKVKQMSRSYHDIFSLEHSSGLGMHTLVINAASGKIHVGGSKERIESFITCVNPKIEPKVTEIDLKMASIQQAIRHLDGIEQFGTRGEIKHLPSILWEDEVPLQIIGGWYNGGNSLLVATDRRVILIDKGVITLKVEDFHYANITSVESRKGFGLGEIIIYVAGNREEITQVPNNRVLVVADFIRNKVHELKTPGPPAPAPAPAPASIADELLKFSELLEKGLISQAEFDAQKAKLLGS